MKLCATCILLLIQFSATAQKDHAVFISGRFSGDVDSVKSIGIIFSTNYIYNDVDFDTTVTVNKKGQFTLKIPSVKRIGKIRQFVIYYKRKINEVENDQDLLPNYIVEPGDNIKMVINVRNDWVTNIRVSGIGSAKYQCRSNLILQDFTFNKTRRKFSALLGRNYYWNPENLEEINNRSVDFQASMIAELEIYKDLLSSVVYEIMKADVIGSINFAWEAAKSGYYSRIDYFSGNDSMKKEKVRKFYLSHFLLSDSFPDHVTALSPDFVDYIYVKELNQISFEQRISSEDVSYHDIYYKIRNTHKGQLRERLLMLMIIDPFRNGKLSSMGAECYEYIRDALSIIKTPSLRNKIENSPLMKAKAGMTAYNFDLPDTSGKTVSLSDLKGNIVLMDMWFTGCTGCVIFANKLKKEIKPELKDAHQFKIISICVDDDRDKWMKSLYSNKYTEIDNINLHLPQGKKNADFFKVPMIKYYGLTGLPFILLIDRNGKIISQLTNSDKKEDIVALIKESLLSK